MYKRLAAFALNLCDAALIKFSPLGGDRIYAAAIAGRKAGASFLIIDSYLQPSDLVPRTETSPVFGDYVGQQEPVKHNPEFYYDEPMVDHSRTIMALERVPFKRFMDVADANKRLASNRPQSGAPRPS